MSLTNDQITAKNFQAFYNQIQPYLNGSVPVIANKFDKANLYSETEKIVGQWIDGKPLYQKTIDCGTLPNSANKNISHNIENIDIVTDARGIGIQLTDNGNFYPLPFSYPANSGTGANIQLLVKPTEIRIFTGQNRDYIVSSYVTLQYTKTTDQQISIGVDTDYSTTEKIIGTWIDGKPLYQKTISIGALPNNSEKTIATGISDLDLVLEYTGFSYSSTVRRPLPYVYPNATLLNGVWVQQDNSVWNIHCRTGTDRTNENAYITIKYTKTTD